MDRNIVELNLAEGYSAKVCLFGATVTSWMNDGREQLFLSSSSKMDGTKAVRGGIPIVFPNFGPWDNGPQHGFARISWWKMINNEKADGVAKAQFTLEQNETTLSMWNHKFQLLYEVEMKPGTLKTSLTIKNCGGGEFDFTTLLHTYLRVPDIDNCIISGFAGSSYTDKVSKETDKVEEREEIRISGNVDSIYRNTKELAVNGPGVDIKVEKCNLPDTVLWNPWIQKAKEMSDFDDDGYKKMVCIEPGYVHERKTLNPGEEFKCSQKLCVTNGRQSSI